ncbi:MAG: CRISPR-associated endonuclease Cas3'' [Rectinema sp.]
MMESLSGSNAIAHVRKNEDGAWDEPHWLKDHLIGTAELAKQFASVFDSASWGFAEGIGHDTGKALEKWQTYLKVISGYDEEAHLETKAGKQEHSGPSARLAEEVFGKGIGRILAYCIAGHHAGLPDWIGSQSALAFRLQQTTTLGIPDAYKTALLGHRPGQAPWKFDTQGLDLSLWLRMLFSCLVDADFLDTEKYMNPEKFIERSQYLPLSLLLTRFNEHMVQKSAHALKEANTPVNRIRQRVLADCRSAANLAPGIFSLTVPTGGGKTLSSMAFALEHAVRYGKERVIYVIPYTSIIEQNADVFREALGKDQVVEHHSNLDDNDATPQARLAAENWDAPVIVTTSVQFFESLFAAKTSRCRKLHSIANSVVVLDEAQLVPVEFLEPILAIMKLLCEHYKVTFVICTATQPAFEKQDDLPKFPGFPKGSMREIIQNVPRLYSELKRVKVELPLEMKTPRTWEEISKELLSVDRVLCVVSDRKSCRELFTLMPKGSYHLSALMCAQHRSDLIADIKKKLESDKVVRVVSTQLVEAGVDIDFPVVYRAMAGLDSIVQAAGRCNREGKLNAEGKLGKVVVFIPSRKAPIGILRKASETAMRMLEQGILDPIDQSVFAPYFSELYWKANSLDAKGIMKLLQPDISECGIQFRSAAEAFKIIDDSMQRTILVPYGNGEALIEKLNVEGPDRHLLRKLQRYSVNIYLNQFAELEERGSLEEVYPGIFALSCKIEYDDDVGLLIDEMPSDPEAFIVI